MPSFDTVLDPNLVEVRTRSTSRPRRSAPASISRARAAVELKDKEIILYADSDFQIGQVMRRAGRQADQAQRRHPLPRPTSARSRRSAATRSSRSSSVRRHRGDTGQEDPEADQAEQDQGAGRIQGDTVRVTGAKRDDLQAAMAWRR
jgi:hypothetical protein